MTERLNTKLPETVLDYFTCRDPSLMAAVQRDGSRLSRAGVSAGFVNFDHLPTSFGKFAHQRAAQLVRRPDVKDGGPTGGAGAVAALKVLARNFHLLLSLELAGRKTFLIAPSLVNRLLETRVDAPAEALALPFRSLLLVFSDEAALTSFHEGSPFGAAPRRGAVSVVVIEVDPPEGRRLVIGSFHVHGGRCHGAMHRSLAFREGTLDDLLTTEWRGSATPGHKEEFFQSDGLRFHRLVINTLLYLGSHNARVASARKASPQSRGSALLTYQVVGEGLAPLTKSPGAGSGGGSPRGSVVGRRLVMGHWKHHAHGEGRQLRKLIWIEPYWRGPEFGEVINRARFVRGPATPGPD